MGVLACKITSTFMDCVFNRGWLLILYWIKWFAISLCACCSDQRDLLLFNTVLVYMKNFKFLKGFLVYDVSIKQSSTLTEWSVQHPCAFKVASEKWVTWRGWGVSVCSSVPGLDSLQCGGWFLCCWRWSIGHSTLSFRDANLY